jgi:hypothetical protein
LTRYIPLAIDFAVELAEVTVLTAWRKWLGMHILEARICLLERQIDSVLERAREGECVAGKGGRR